MRAADSHVLHRHSRMELPIAVRGDGPYVIDSTGKRYLDASGGAAVSCLGHSHPDVIAAIKAQLDALAYAHSGFFTNPAMEALADLLVAAAPMPQDAACALDRVYFVSGGSEAMEASLKLARQYCLEIGQPARRHIISRRQSYHGNTLGALAAGGNLWRRQPFEPLLIETHQIAPCYPYRERYEGESLEAYGLRAADQLEAKIAELGPESVLAFLAEPVVGATAGAVPAVPGYLKRIREICDRHGVLLILDEVMCGMGRTGWRFACEEDGVVPDLLAMAKGLGAGYQPIGAVLVGSHLVDAIAAGSGFFQHGHTYMGHPTACAAALAVQQVIDRDGLLARVRGLGEGLDARLQARLGQHPHVGDIRGRGLFRGLELVSDRETRAPFDPQLRLHARIKQAAMADGLMVYPMGGTIDGQAGDHILLAPPFIIDEGHLDRIVAGVAAAIDSAIAAARA
ncbi:MAG: aspartate aminotransferase family protein [Alphaproteobacteria bacterium]